MPVGMSSQIMSYLYMGLAAFIVIFALFGLINGFRKSIYRLITFAVFIVLLLLFGGVFTNTLINTDISQYLDQFNITLPEGATGGTIRDIVGSLLESNLGSAATTELRDAVLAIVSLACMVIYFIFMMTVVRWLYLIVTWIIWLFIKPKRRKKEDLVTEAEGDGEEEVKGDVHIKKRGKRRLLGMGVGAVKGLVCYFLLVTVLLTGPLSVVPNLDEFFTNEEPSTSENLADELVTTTSQGIPINVDGQTWTEIKNFVSSYKKSPFYVVAGGDSKGFSINSMVNDNIWKGSYGKYSISLRKEIGALTDVAASAMKLFGKVDGSNVEVDHETFVSLSEVIEGLSNSEYLMSVLPVLTDSFFNHEKVKEVLPEDFDLEGLKKIEWKKDFQTLAQTVLDLESIADWKDITGLKFENFQKEGVTNFFKGLSELTFLNYTLDGVVKFALELEPVKENIGELELEIDDLVWSEEINQLGNIVNAFLDVGIKSFDEVKGLDIFDKISLPGLREFTKALFGVKLVDRLFPEIMSKVVLKSIDDEDVRSLFDFEAVRESGWSKEFDTLIRLISEAKNEGSESPMDLMTTDGQINFKVLNNLRTKTILNSTLLAKATVQLLLNAKAGKGFLSHLEDVIVIPKNLANKDAEDWLSYRYVCEKEDQVYKDNYGAGEVGDIISNAAYKAAVTAGKITADNWQREAYQGELYQAVDGLKQAITEMDIVSYKAFPSKPAEYVNLLSKVSDATIDSLASSTVLNASITKQILKLSNESGYEDFIVVPKEAVDYVDKGTADEYKMLKCDEGHNEMRAIIRSFQVLSTHIDISDMGNVGLDVLAELLNPYLVDDYVCKEAYGEYTLGQVLSVDDYNDLSSDDKDYWQARYPVDSYRCVNPAGGVIGSVITKEAYEALDEVSKAYFKEVYKAYAYECVIPYGTYTEGHNITVEEFNDLAAAEKDNWQPLVTNLDRALNSRIFYCSLSKLLVKYGEDEDSVLQIPNSVINMKENADEGAPAIKVITKLEIENTMKAIHDLDLTDNLENLKLDDINDKLNEPSADDTTRLVVDDVLNSKIIHCTLSKYLLDFVDKEDAVVTVPNTVKALEADKDIITKEELRSLVVATKRLNLNFNELENLNLTTLINTLNGADPINPAQKVSDTVLTSKIYHCTISKKLSDMATKEDSKLLLPEETSVMEGDIKAIQKPELVNLLEAIGVVDIDFENLNDLDYVELVNSMNDVAYPDTADTSTKLEVTLRSAIFHATFSDVIIDLDGDSITVPASVKDSTIYTAWGTVNVLDALEKGELKALVKALKVLGVVEEQEGGPSKVNTSINLITDLLDATEVQEDGTVAPDAPRRIDYIVGNETKSITGSEIIRATISKFVIDESNLTAADKSLVIVNDNRVLEKDGEVRLLKKEEFANMITSINSLGLVDENGLSDNIGVSLINKMCTVPVNKVPGDEGYDVRDYVFDKRPVDYITGYVGNNGSWVLKATFSKYIIQQEQIVTPSVEVELFAATSETNDVPIIKKDELKNLIIGLGPDGIGAVNDNNEISNINNLITNTFDNKDEVSASRVLTATITSKLTNTLKMERDAYDNEQQTKCDADGKVLAGPAIKVIKGGEMKKFLTALEILGVSDFQNAKLRLDTIFTCLDEDYPDATPEEIEAGTNKKMDYLLKSRIVWHTMSEEIKGFKNEDDPDPLLVAPTYANRIVYFLDGEKSAYDSAIYEAYEVDPIVRFGTEELKAVINTFKVIVSDAGENFNISDEDLIAIYKDDKREQVASTVSESALMTMNVKKLVTKAVDSVFGTDPYFSADTIKTNIDNINNCEWKSYVEAEVLDTYDKVAKAGRAQTYAYSDGTNDYYDCQLVNLLNAINQFENFTANVGATEKETGRTLRTSLRALNNSNVTNGSLPKFFYTYWDPLFDIPTVATKYTSFAVCYNDVFARAYAETDLYTMAYIDAASLRHVNLNRYATGTLVELESLD